MAALEEAGKEVVGTAGIDFLCNKLLIARHLAAYMDQLQHADALVVVSCEVSDDVPCGWVQIYERLEKLGRLDNLYKFVEAPNYDLLRGRDADRRTTWWAIENQAPKGAITGP